MAIENVFKPIFRPVFRGAMGDPVPIFSAGLENDLLDRVSQNLGAFTRASAATYIGKDRLIYDAATNEERYEYIIDPILGVAIGDSFTQTTTYPTYVSNNLRDCTVDNKGTASENLTTIEARFYTDVVVQKPKFVLIEGGIVDLTAAVSDPNTTMQTKMTSMITMAQSAGIIPTVVNVGPWKNAGSWTADKQTWTDTYNTWLASYTTTNSITLIDIYTLLEDPGTDELDAAYDSGDGLHPNTAGYTVMGEQVVTQIRATINALTRSARTALLLEPGSTNYWINSDPPVADIGDFGATEVTIATYSWDIGKLVNAVSFGDNSINRSFYYRTGDFVATDDVVFSCFMEMGGGQVPRPATDFRIVIDNATSVTYLPVIHVKNNVYIVSAYDPVPTGGANRPYGIQKVTAGSDRPFKVSGFQIENTKVRSSYIPTTAATVTRASEAGVAKWTLNNIPAVKSVLAAEGTMLVKGRPGYDYDAYGGGASGIVACRDNVSSLLRNQTPGIGSFYSYDSVTTGTAGTINWSAGIWYYIIVQWGYDDSGEKFRVGTYSSGTITWGTPAAFDGAFTLGTFLNLGYSLQAPMHLKDLGFFAGKLTDDQIIRIFQ